ncbi:MAG: hypothetical protein Q8L14_38620 [Myxococcales bacterium]|nr:hypothetical protein [Myxococcales bacterium]
MRSFFPGCAALALLAGCAPARDDEARLSLPALVRQRVVEGGPNPSAVTVTLDDRGNCPLVFSATTTTVDGAAWVSVSPSAGVVAPSGQATLTLSFDVITSALLPGLYTGTLEVTGTCQTTGQPARGSPSVVALNLVVVAAGTGNRWLDFAGSLVPTARRDATLVASEFGDGTVPDFASLLFGGENAAGPVASPFLYRDGVGWEDISALDGGPGPRTRHTATAVSSEFSGAVVWGGQVEDGGVTNTGAFLAGQSPLQWVPVTVVNAPIARAEHTATWQMPSLVVWGGRDVAGQVLQTGGRYRIDFDQWLPLSVVGAPAARRRHHAVFDSVNFQVLIWGGLLASGLPTNTGGRYDTANDVWQTMSTVAAPTPREGASVVWTGTKMVVWGGRDAGGLRNDGASYEPSTDTWQALPSMGAPAAREGHTAVWTGTAMIVWGGLSAGGVRLDSGGLFDEALGTWVNVPVLGAPGARAGHAAVWHLDRMLVVSGATSSGLTGGGRAFQP